jgi:DNA repair protein RecN (Recombination protein N)
MQALGRDHQVICITHLPQVAATASSRFVVTKDVTRGRTFSNLREVTGKLVKRKIAKRMLGGKSDFGAQTRGEFVERIMDYAR